MHPDTPPSYSSAPKREVAKVARRWRSVTLLLQRLAQPGLLRDSAATYGFTAAILIANLAAGVLVARLLGPSGRGEITAITNAAALIPLVFLLGSRQAIAYHQAHHPEQGARLLSTWLVVMLPTAALAVIAAELLLPVLFSAQTEDAVRLGSLYVLVGIPLAMLSEQLQGVLLGDHDFFFWNTVRFTQPASVAVGYLILWGLGAFTIESALIVFAASLALMCIVSAFRIIRRHGLDRPSMTIGKATIWYGLRGSITNVVALANTRLDLLIIPAFLAATSVGYYSVATNVSWILYTLASPLSALILPVSARRGRQGFTAVVKAMQATIATGIAIAVVVGAFASVLVKFVYGSEFGPAALSLRLLLPGAVLYAGATIVASGILGAGRPGTAAIPQITGLVVTAAGLALFLPSGGIEAAAIISTASYGVVFLLSLFLYQKTTQLPWKAFFSPRKLPMRQ